MAKKVLTQQEIADKVKVLCNGLSSKNLVELISELYSGLYEEEKEKLLNKINNN